jgi:hypothetical protein
MKPDETFERVADLLCGIGWDSFCDAQHERLRDTMPALRALLAATPEPQPAPPSQCTCLCNYVCPMHAAQPIRERTYGSAAPPSSVSVTEPCGTCGTRLVLCNRCAARFKSENEQ